MLAVGLGVEVEVEAVAELESALASVVMPCSMGIAKTMPNGSMSVRRSKGSMGCRVTRG